MKRALLIAAAALVLAGCGRAEREHTVVLWHSYQGDERAALERVIAELEAADPELRVQPVSVAYDAFADKITNAIPNGNGPDLFVFAHDRIGDWVASGIVEPIEYYVDEELADLYARDAIAAMAYDDSLYGLPLAVKSVVMFYRTDLMPTPPRSTDELVAWSRDHAGTYALAYQNTDLYGHAMWLHGFGGEVFDEGQLAIDSAEAIAAAEFAHRLAKDHVTPRESTSTDVATMFNEGKTAAAISGPWFIADIKGGVPWAVTTLPVVTPTGRPAAPFLGAEGVLMSARARDKDRAFAVMQALASDASAIARARAAKQVVPNIGAYADPAVGSDAALAGFRAQLEHTVPMPATPAMRMVWTPYKVALQQIVAQGANAADALGAAQREVAGYIAGAGASSR